LLRLYQTGRSRSFNLAATHAGQSVGLSLPKRAFPSKDWSIRVMTRHRANRAGRTRRIALTAAAAGLWLLALAGPAFAHVTISPGAAPRGSTAELTFRVPNEESKADVTRLQLQVPTDHPIAQFLVRQVPGWTITVRTVTLARPLVTDDGSFSTAVADVTWAGGKIPPGQYQDFSVSADPLPSGVSQLVFKAIQTYSNGDVVRWIDVPQAGQPAPEHPAPVLTLTAAAGEDASGAAVTGGMAAPAGPAPASPDPASPAPAGPAPASGNFSGTTALALGATGLAAGLLGLAAGGAAWLRVRRGGRHRAGQP
jgi:uncharacterized protein YcnI